MLHAESGEYIESETEVICAKVNDAQNFGAGQTYARRFGLQSMLFIPSEDDDGNYASGRAAPATKPTYTPAPSVVATAIAVAKEMTAATAVEPTVKTSTFRKGTKAIADAVVAKVANTETQADMWE